MKDRYARLSLSRICGLFDVTRQAYYQHSWARAEKSLEELLIIKQIRHFRENHPRLGGRKLFQLLEPFMLEHQIKLGRDALFKMLSRNYLLVRKRKKKGYNTQSSHWLRTYPNLMIDMEVKDPQQLWVSDITYLAGCYLSLVTDAYSRKIVGYHISDNLKSIETMKALEMAISNMEESTHELIHHSARGVQYCAGNYVNLLKKHKIAICMTQDSNPLDNSIAERINGILKQEYLF